MDAEDKQRQAEASSERRRQYYQRHEVVQTSGQLSGATPPSSRSDQRRGADQRRAPPPPPPRRNGSSSAAATSRGPYVPSGAGPAVHLRSPLSAEGGSTITSTTTTSASHVITPPQSRTPSLIPEKKGSRGYDKSPLPPAGEPSGSSSGSIAHVTPAQQQQQQQSQQQQQQQQPRGILRTATQQRQSSLIMSGSGSGSGRLDCNRPSGGGIVRRGSTGTTSSTPPSSGGGGVLSPLTDGARSPREDADVDNVVSSDSYIAKLNDVFDDERIGEGTRGQSVAISINENGGGGAGSAGSGTVGGVRSRRGSLVKSRSTSLSTNPPRSALRRVASATIKRRSDPRLPLYHSRDKGRTSGVASAAAVTGSGEKTRQLRYSQTRSSSSAHSPNGPRPSQQGLSPISLSPSLLTHAAFLLIIFYVMLDSKAKVDRSTAQLRYYREEEARVNARVAQFESRARQLSLEVDRLRRDNDALEDLKSDQLAKLEKLDSDRGIVREIETERAKVLARDEIIKNQVVILQRRIQGESRRETVDKFGPGPYRVEVALEFPGQPKYDDDGAVLPYKFHLEMASLEDMPHSVQLFMEQVHHGLWDGCAFVWNPDHLMLASPHVHAEQLEDGTFDIYEDDDKREDFIETGYTSISFQEYSDNMPHKQYTLGFAGRPGGPNFYINMKDNTRVHGPDGKTGDIETVDREGLEGDADPCFARVVAGFDAVDRMHALPVNGEGEGWQRNAFKDDVFIRYAKILPNKK